MAVLHRLYCSNIDSMLYRATIVSPVKDIQRRSAREPMVASFYMLTGTILSITLIFVFYHELFSVRCIQVDNVLLGYSGSRAIR